MHLTFYALRALAGEWNEAFGGAVIRDAYSVHRDELSLVLETINGIQTIRTSVQPGHRFLFDQDGGGRPKRNATTLFESILGREVSGIRIADRDRMLDIELSNGALIRVVLFGPQANVFVSDDGLTVREAFRTTFRKTVGNADLPLPRSAPDPANADELRARWPGGARPIAQALRKAVPLFDPLLAEEAATRAALSVSDACLVDLPHFEALAAAVESVRRELEAPRPLVYRTGRAPAAMSLIPLANPPAPETESFETVRAAIRMFIRADLGQRAFMSEYDPLVRVLETSVMRNRERAGHMERELTAPSRADAYERWGHLLMATPVPAGAGFERTEAPDVFEGAGAISIPLDPALTRIENANRYYAKARQARRSREEAQARIAGVQSAARSAESLLGELGAVVDRSGLRDFQKANESELSVFVRSGKKASESLPFRRFHLGPGFEVWVGRNAKENDALTFKTARKHDYWLHARGVAGSHTVLRRTRKDIPPPKHILETAASIAAWFSKARGSALAPVIVTERKYVRKPRKAAPGQVLVEREEVLIVPPALPAED